MRYSTHRLKLGGPERCLLSAPGRLRPHVTNTAYRHGRAHEGIVLATGTTLPAAALWGRPAGPARRTGAGTALHKTKRRIYESGVRRPYPRRFHP